MSCLSSLDHVGVFVSRCRFVVALLLSSAREVVGPPQFIKISNKVK